MKTLQEFEAYLDSEKQLSETVKGINTARKNNIQAIVIISILAIAFVVGIAWFFLKQSTPVTPEEIDNAQNNYIYVIIAFIGFGFLISFGYSRFIAKQKISKNPMAYGMSAGGFQYDFKDKVIRQMIGFWNPDFKYQINNFLKLSDIMQSGMLYEDNYIVQGSDLIKGEEEGVNFRFCDTQVTKEKKFTKKDEDAYETIFFGSFFIADFNKSFKAPVYVYPSKFSGNSFRYAGEKIHLEDPEFSKKFNVYGADQIEARYILTTAMMERIKSLCKKMGNNVYFIFAQNSIYIANNNGKDRFEMSWFKSIEKREVLLQYYDELSEQLSIIHELKLNVNIWNTVNNE
jgi:hypothetical protein